jgi:hypothetical protein
MCPVISTQQPRPARFIRHLLTASSPLLLLASVLFMHSVASAAEVRVVRPSRPKNLADAYISQTTGPHTVTPGKRHFMLQTSMVTHPITVENRAHLIFSGQHRQNDLMATSNKDVTIEKGGYFELYPDGQVSTAEVEGTGIFEGTVNQYVTVNGFAHFLANANIGNHNKDSHVMVGATGTILIDGNIHHKLKFYFRRDSAGSAGSAVIQYNNKEFTIRRKQERDYGIWHNDRVVMIIPNTSRLAVLNGEILGDHGTRILLSNLP